MTSDAWQRYERNRANGKLRRPIGSAEAAPPFDKQPSDSQPDITLLTIPEAAELLTISVSSMRRLQQGRRIPFFKVGGGIRFAKEDLVSYLAQQRVGALG